MRFTPTADQQALLDALTTLFEREAGAERARELGMDGHDDALLERLADGGYLDLANADGIGSVTAALAVESASRAIVRANLPARMLVAPALLGDDAPTRVALAVHGSDAPVRYAPGCDLALVIDGDVARVIERPAVTKIESFYGYPFGSFDTGGGRSLGSGSGERLRAWWQTALAVEASGLLLGAHHLTVEYLKQRVQFGKPLGTLQALQHRLANSYVSIAGTQWLGRKAAWSGAAPEAAAAAATHAVLSIKATANDLHQLTGAIGFTTEYDLHLFTSRLWALRVELGGIDAHARTLTAARWL